MSVDHSLSALNAGRSVAHGNQPKHSLVKRLFVLISLGVLVFALAHDAVAGGRMKPRFKKAASARSSRTVGVKIKNRRALKSIRQKLRSKSRASMVRRAKARVRDGARNLRNRATNLVNSARRQAKRTRSRLSGFVRERQNLRLGKKPWYPKRVVSRFGVARLCFGRSREAYHHAFRHTDKMGLSRREVQAAIRRHVPSVMRKIPRGGSSRHEVEVAGKRIQYSAYKFPDGVISVGRVHGVSKAIKR